MSVRVAAERKPLSCLYCKKRIPKEKSKAKKYCSTYCAQKAGSARLRELNPSLGLPTGTVGALSELVAACDLMKRGYAVFRALSPDCACDLAILMENRLLRVEVKTGYRYPNGKIQYPVHNKEKLELFDVLAVVINAFEVVYVGLPGVDPPVLV